MSRNNDRAKKNETASKVKEMQMRQKNWFKERQEHLEGKGSLTSPQTKQQPDTKTTKSSDHNPSTKSGKVGVDKSRSNQNQTGGAKTSVLQPKGKFKHWLEARETQSNAKKAVASDETESSVDVLKVLSSRSPEFASPDLEFNDSEMAQLGGADDPYSTFSERSGRDAMDRLLSPQDFNALADSIVARVKQDISTDVRTQPHNVRENTYYVLKKSKSPAGSTDLTRAEKGHPEVNTRGHRGHGEVDISSHHCPCCRCLMLPPSHIPLISIPCGHSVCQRCCDRTEQCPSCDGHVTSRTCNMMLLQIIQDFHNKESRRRQRIQQTKSYSPDNYDSKSSHQSYREQHQNLLARQEVMMAEVESVTGHMLALSDQIQTQQRQVQNIAQQETKLRRQIKELEDKLRELTSHKEGYTEEQSRVQKQYNTEANRLNLIKETLLTLEIEIDKVQLLKEG